MAPWVDAGKDRLRRDDDDRHVLLRSGTRFVEFHMGAVHVYDTTAELDDDRAVTDGPLDKAAWVATFLRPDLEAATDGELWQALAGDEYTKPAP